MQSMLRLFRIFLSGRSGNTVFTARTKISTAISAVSTHQPAGATFRLSGDLLYADGVADGTPVSLYNLQGVLVGQTTVEGGAISLAGLQKGVYAVQLDNLGSTLIRK